MRADRATPEAMAFLETQDEALAKVEGERVGGPFSSQLHFVKRRGFEVRTVSARRRGRRASTGRRETR